ncbi:MAG: hypothetical protein WCH01_21955, partial [Methylococcaceae bacterium]
MSRAEKFRGYTTPFLARSVRLPTYHIGVMKMTHDEFNYIADLQNQAEQLAVVLFCRASIEPLDSQRRERLK